MIASSRPLRFVVLLLGSWATMRIVQLWPVTGPMPALAPTLLDVIAPPLDATPITRERAARAIAPVTFQRISRAEVLTAPSIIGASVSSRRAGGRAPDPVHIGLALATNVRSGAAQLDVGPIGSPVLGIERAPSRVQASAWTIVRGGGGAASPFAPQLGGSQAGVRLTYALDDAHRFALAGRLSTALGTRQREAAIGVDWRPTALPIHVVVEQRIGIEGARGGPSIGVIAGFGPTPVAAQFALEAYGQAGGIARDGRVEGYADGAARLARPVAAVGAARIDLGLGAWGGAQRGAARLDVGPTASAALPVTGKTVRISLDWRQRVAGRVRPDSGPAVSIGTDF